MGWVHGENSPNSLKHTTYTHQFSEDGPETLFNLITNPSQNGQYS
ncbi:hypothetical protein M595_3350 [Lyngbya aestuarii BL J]|uniref:Uncharacterized protein n=1 Tax=Lyngbya aestuarii BL J TaxID=1348334 RepID=U7QJT8_9CYAN|nr:hypothetical protein M595_3350 [Lyngbya aestuarii BL J]